MGINFQTLCRSEGQNGPKALAFDRAKEPFDKPSPRVVERARIVTLTRRHWPGSTFDSYSVCLSISVPIELLVQSQAMTPNTVQVFYSRTNGEKQNTKAFSDIVPTYFSCLPSAGFMVAGKILDFL
jgi:hypothetical protein